MALNSEQIKLIEEIQQKILDSIDNIESSIPAIQENIYNELRSEILKLDTKSGDIKTSVSNLKQVQKLKSNLQETFLSEDYIKATNQYIDSFAEVKTLLDSYFSTLAIDFNSSSELYKEILLNSVNVTKETLLGSGVNADIITPISDYLSKSVTSGSNITEFIEDLKVKIIGDKENIGYLLKNVKQLATDGLNQYSANYIESVSNDLGFNYYLYQGNSKETSRCFCLEREGKYFSKKEVQHWGETPSLWNTCKTKIHKGGGRIDGTNKTTIFTYRGGWQCGHQLYPVADNLVPKDVIERN